MCGGDEGNSNNVPKTRIEWLLRVTFGGSSLTFSCFILSSILALFTKPGDQYSLEDSLGVFQKGENEQVVHGNQQKEGEGGTYCQAHVMTGSK